MGEIVTKQCVLCETVYRVDIDEIPMGRLHEPYICVDGEACIAAHYRKILDRFSVSG